MGQKAGALLKSSILSPMCPSVWLTAVCPTVNTCLQTRLCFCFWLSDHLSVCVLLLEGVLEFLTSTAAKCLFQFSWVGLIYLIHLPNTAVIFRPGFFSLSALFLMH